MRLGFLPADASLRYDPVMQSRLWDHVPNFVNENPDVTVVPISYFSDYTFNPELLKLRGKKYIIADSFESYGEWPDGKSHIFGISDTPAFGRNSDWLKLSAFVRENPPILQLVRELYKKDESRFIQPLEWPAYMEPWQLEDKRNFDARPLEVFYSWGMSNCARSKLHGKIFSEACDRGYEVISHLDYIDAKINEPQRKWVSTMIPHSHRVHMDIIARRQAQSKISISMPGAARKCFRHTEAPLHTVMAMMDDNLAWSFEWKHLHNCIRLTEGNEIQNLESALRTEDLHAIYLNSQETLDMYRPNNYIQNHILPAISAVL